MLATSMPHYDILGIGNAIVDLIHPVDPSFLDEQTMCPGSMALIDAARAAQLTALMPSARESSGGSVANSCAVASMLGARVAFFGKVADDPLGDIFRREILAAGVHYPTPPLIDQEPTARCLILVTPDAQRTMSTYLGACVTLSTQDLDRQLIAQSSVTYLEGYLFDPPCAQAAFHTAALWAHDFGRQVALSLSDAFCVDRHRAAFLALLPHVDILFANEAELLALYQCSSLDQAADRAMHDVSLVVVTRGGAGSVILHGDERVVVRAEPTQLVDTTGAGDCYAAGFLTAYISGQTLTECGAFGSRTAALCIGLYGARPSATALRQLALVRSDHEDLIL